MVISIQTIAGHTLFSCTVGDLGHVSGIGDVSLDSWACLEGMISVVRRTGHSSYYVEKGMSAMGKTAKQMGIQTEHRVNGGGAFHIFCLLIGIYPPLAFPIWLEVSGTNQLVLGLTATERPLLSDCSRRLLLWLFT